MVRGSVWRTCGTVRKRKRLRSRGSAVLQQPSAEFDDFLSKSDVTVIRMSTDRAVNREPREPFRLRGVVEGFYGPPYTFAQRRDLFCFLARAGLNTYLYAPKLDPFHRERWKEPYPRESLEHFGELVEVGRAIGVRFVFGLSPGLSFDPDVGDTGRLHEKLCSLVAVGVHDFCLLFDDITPEAPGAEPRAQVTLTSSTFAAVRSQDAQATLCFVPNYYSGTAEELETGSSRFGKLFPISSANYYRAYAHIPAEVAIVWTGPGVFTHRLTVAAARRFREFVGRPVLVWDNYPANDTFLSRQLFLAPYQGREAGVESVVDGVLLNPMLQPEATKIPLWTAGEFFTKREAYNPWEAGEEALRVVSDGRGINSLRTLVEQFQSHPLIGDSDESSCFANAVKGFIEARSSQGRAEVWRLCETFARNAQELESTLGNRSLLAELREPARKLSQLGAAGLLALRLLEAKDRGAAIDILPLEERLAATGANPWLVGANTPVPASLALRVGEREAHPVDVFQRFFDHLLKELRR